MKDIHSISNTYICATFNKTTTMGKGDKKTRKGKISRSSYGNTRPQGLKKKAAAKKAAEKKS